MSLETVAIQPEQLHVASHDVGEVVQAHQADGGLRLGHAAVARLDDRNRRTRAVTAADVAQSLGQFVVVGGQAAAFGRTEHFGRVKGKNLDRAEPPDRNVIHLAAERMRGIVE